ncbi:MAG: glycerol-3-phosphate acyltransferase [Chloroflexi bacterium]|nr:glycerol-3-phosphate acyltransferase [Chloroflexota bacterium]
MTGILLWTLAGFILGSIPFSLLMGKLLAHRDIRSVGDGNPGGTNALKAGGLKAGIPAILLDIGKGFLPVYLAQRAGLGEWSLLPVCLAPILGHAFSPFLRFKGGKALGATGGVWVALVGLWAFPLYGLLAVPATLLQTEHAWAASAGMLSLLGYAILAGPPWLVAFAACNTILIAWTHRHDLARHPQLRPWLGSLSSRGGL